MSIISEALKKVESISSREYMDKMFGPERKETYKKESVLTDAQLRKQPASSGGADLTVERYPAGFKLLLGVGVLGGLAIAILTFANIFMPFNEVKLAESGRIPDMTTLPIEAETYSQPKKDIAIIAETMDVVEPEDMAGDIPVDFRLNGIVYAAENSWAIINNEVVRVGDMLEGAKIVSISPQEVTLFYNNDRLDLTVK